MGDLEAEDLPRESPDVLSEGLDVGAFDNLLVSHTAQGPDAVAGHFLQDDGRVRGDDRDTIAV
ncbi:hypothetical protein ACFRNJ_39065 [Streptomyces sp. NPDC056721]|uniref:hypothetical protein n=1 Tax=Streptomyces sp. NPDC056721 TaxID=3345923 RepID=UPI00367874D1